MADAPAPGFTPVAPAPAPADPIKPPAMPANVPEQLATPASVLVTIAVADAKQKIKLLTAAGLAPAKIGKDVYDAAGLPFPG